MWFFYAIPVVRVCMCVYALLKYSENSLENKSIEIRWLWFATVMS